MNPKTALRLIVCIATLLAAISRDAAAQSITVTPSNPSIAVGQTQQFTVPEVSPPIDVTAGDYHACVLLQNGGVRCFGRNNESQLGEGSVIDSSLPISPSGMTQAAGVTTGGFHSCAVLSDHTVKCWGQNEVGQVGDGTTSGARTPVTVSGITTAIAVAAGY